MITTEPDTRSVDERISGHLALALDLDDLEVARRLGRELQPWFRVAKVGLELFSAAGPDAVEALRELGYDVFVDLKMHDIPTTVGKAARVIGSIGASYLTIHASGGEAMLRAGDEGLREGAAAAGHPEPTTLAVTVLTSDGPEAALRVPDRVATALAVGCGGVVCAVAEAPLVRELGPELTILTPGIRPAGTSADDQARPATPRAALAAGADLMVIGRAVTAAPDPAAAAEALVASLRTEV
ncbi:MAG: orotidine-5'-phosphate decarboxylase [Actinobacteria bacterium]|nr:orotidine-5'-phosphate decarboxylase [Actinomycetota bacterium]